MVKQRGRRCSQQRNAARGIAKEISLFEGNTNRRGGSCMLKVRTVSGFALLVLLVAFATTAIAARPAVQRGLTVPAV